MRRLVPDREEMFPLQRLSPEEPRLGLASWQKKLLQQKSGWVCIGQGNAKTFAFPVVKQILGIMCKGMSLRQDPPDESDSVLMKLLSMAVTELAVLKLEIEQQKTTEA